MASNSNSNKADNTGNDNNSSCTICLISSGKRCGKCKNTYYCSVEHQKKDWKHHKSICVGLNGGVTKEEPWSVYDLKTYVWKDLLPPPSEYPAVWANYGFQNCGIGKMEYTEEIMLFGLYIGMIKIIRCDLKKLHEAVMSGKLKDFITEVFQNYSSNQVTQGAYFQWFLKNTHLVDNSYPLVEAVRDVRYAGVKISCNGDRAASGLFVPVSVPANDPIYTTGYVCHVSAMIGIPLLVRRCPSKESAHFDRATLDNQPTTYMLINPISGFTPPQWQSHVGTTVFVRKDRKPLTQIHLEAIWQFHSHLLKIWWGDDSTVATSKMNKESFEQFWESFKSGKAEQDQVSPFDV